MKKNIINLLLKILLLLLILYFIIDFSNKYEGLKNFGEEIIEYKAPIGYKKVMNIIKHPEKAKKSYSIDTSDTELIDNISGDISYNVNLFNNNNNYSNRKIMRDLKFFNNSTNLMLYHKDNSTNDILYNNHPNPDTPLYESFVSDPQNHEHSIGLDSNFAVCFEKIDRTTCSEYDDKQLFDNYPYSYEEFNKKKYNVSKDLEFFYNASSILKNHHLNDQLPK